MAELRHVLGLYGRLLGVQIRSQMQFRLAFALDLAATALIGALEFGSLALVLQRFDGISGWSLGEVAFLYGQVEIAFGLMDLLFSGFDPPVFGQGVRRGTFDQLLLRPVSITLQVMGSEFVLRRLGRVAFGLGIFGLSLTLIDVPWTAVKLLYLPLVILSMSGFFGGLYIIGATITFWTVDSIELLNSLTYGGSYTISYPMSIYPDWIRHFFTFVIPAIFLNYFPTLYFLNKPDPFGFPSIAPFLSPLAGLAMLGIALAFWRVGIRYYQSTGS